MWTGLFFYNEKKAYFYMLTLILLETARTLDSKPHNDLR